MVRARGGAVHRREGVRLFRPELCIHYNRMTDGPTDEVVDALMDDLQQLNELMQERGPTPFLVRVYARSIFSIFDGYAYHLKQKALRRSESAGIQLSNAELEMIYERRGDAPEREGKPKTTPAAENLRFAMKLWARVNGGAAPPRGGQLPSEFDRIRRVRNGITHPKKRSDFNVTGDDARAIGQLFLWFREITEWHAALELQYIDKVEERIRQGNDELRRRIRAAGPVDESVPGRGDIGCTSVVLWT